MKDAKVKGVNWKLIVLMIIFFGAIQWLWPNIIHEPLHYAAMRIQGVPGYMTLDWGFPPHPSTTHTAGFTSAFGAMIFLLLPSIISVVILGILWRKRKYANVWTHFVLASYLGFDLIINVLTYQSANSDFRMLQFIGGEPIALLLAVCCMVLTVPLLMMSLKNEENAEQVIA
jgi:hypothetical protein